MAARVASALVWIGSATAVSDKVLIDVLLTFAASRMRVAFAPRLRQNCQVKFTLVYDWIVNPSALFQIQREMELGLPQVRTGLQVGERLGRLVKPDDWQLAVRDVQRIENTNCAIRIVRGVEQLAVAELRVCPIRCADAF